MKSSFLKTLILGSSLYLLFPILIFFLTYVNLPLGMVFTVGSVVLSFLCLRNCVACPSIHDQDILDTLQKNKVWYILVFALFCIWYFVSGIGGLGLGHTTDVTTGERIIYDLMRYDWPLKMPVPKDSPASSLASDCYYLVYYIAFYLPAGLAGKLTGSFTVACWVECIWGFIGCVLSLCWFFWFLDFRGKSWSLVVCMGIFIFFRTTSFISSYICSFYSLFYWGNSTTLLYGSPQHAIAAWLTASLVYAVLKNDIQIRASYICLAAALLHSPFTLPGVLLLFIMAFFKKEAITYKNIVLGIGLLLLCFLPCALFILSNSFSFPIILTFMNSSFSIPKYLWGVLVLLGIPVTILWSGKKALSLSEKRICYIILLTLFISISFNMGYCNDFPIRVSMAPLFLLNILFSKIYLGTHYKILRICLLAFVLIAASTYPRYVWKRLPSFGVPPTRDIRGFLYDEDITTYQTRIGNRKSLFFRVLAR